jgi:spore maturation protein CgeB
MMKILIADTYHSGLLNSIYQSNSILSKADYQTQLKYLINLRFGTSDFYSRHLGSNGVSAEDLIVNMPHLQSAWADSHQIKYSKILLGASTKLHRLPVVGNCLAKFPGLLHVAIEQVKEKKPDIFFCQDISFFPPAALKQIRKHVSLIVGQIACPLPRREIIKEYDLILTSFPHYVEKLKSLGVRSEYFRIGFDEVILSDLGLHEKDIPVSFVGGISRHHAEAVEMLEHMAQRTPIQFFGYGAERLPANSPILPRHHGEVWGLDMYRTLARSQITINRHIDVAGDYANNMRLFEATGVGTLLITDSKKNIGDLFEPGKEILTYSSKEEAAELVNFYISNPAEAKIIAKAGQKRTLEQHTYKKRMDELNAIFLRESYGSVDFIQK